MNDGARDKIARGIELMSAQKYEMAKGLFKEALELDKKNYEAYIHLGNACVSLEQYTEGIDAFGKALILQPDSGEVLYSLGCVHFLNNEAVEALRYLNRCEEVGFVSAEMYGLMELIFVESEDYVQAVRCANKAIKLEPLNPVPYVDKAQLYVADGKPKEALAVLREVEELLPDSGEPYALEAQIHLQLDEPEQALEVLDRATGRFDGDAGMLVFKARVLNDLGRFDEALELVNRVELLSGSGTSASREAALVRSVSLVGKRDVQASIATLEKSVKDNPSDDEALYLLANECYALEEYEKAERYSSQLIEVPDAEPRYRAAAIFWQAMSMKELGRAEEARAAFDDATSTLRQINIGHPGLAEVYVYRALCNSELGRFDDAYELIDHVISLLPDEASGYAFKAQIADAKGDVELAREMHDKVHALKPDFEF